MSILCDECYAYVQDIEAIHVPLYDPHGGWIQDKIVCSDDCVVAVEKRHDYDLEQFDHETGEWRA